MMGTRWLTLVGDMAPGLPMIQRAILNALANHADQETGYTFVGHATIAKEIGCSRRSVERHIGELAKLGFVNRQRRHTAKGWRTSDACTLSEHAIRTYRPPASPVDNAGPNRQVGGYNTTSNTSLTANLSWPNRQPVKTKPPICRDLNLLVESVSESVSKHIPQTAPVHNPISPPSLAPAPPALSQVKADGQPQQSRQQSKIDQRRAEREAFHGMRPHRTRDQIRVDKEARMAAWHERERRINAAIERGEVLPDMYPGEIRRARKTVRDREFEAWNREQVRLSMQAERGIVEPGMNRRTRKRAEFVARYPQFSKLPH